jgi:phosphohistidine phosphatase
MKEVLILRHGEAVSGDGKIEDFDRQLSKDGILEARQQGKNCMAFPLLPDLIYSSSAIRALTTAILFAEETNYPQKNIMVLPQLYDISPIQLMDIISNTPAHHAKVMVVGHNPVLTVFLHLFTVEGLNQLPTGTLVHIKYEDCQHWKELKDKKGKIITVWKPQR